VTVTMDRLTLSWWWWLRSRGNGCVSRRDHVW
jgi:hypothetical protein